MRTDRGERNGSERSQVASVAERKPPASQGSRKPKSALVARLANM